MASRATVLDRVRRHQAPATPLPALAGDWIRYENPREQFAQMLESVGGQCLVAKDRAEVARLVEQLPEYETATTVCSLVEGVGRRDFGDAQLEQPHDLADVGLTIAEGSFAVAENGAVWLPLPIAGRAVAFLCEHLVLLVSADDVVHTMHDAYERLAVPTMFSQPGFGVFVSGPSKTADIEQCLVIGAHGPRSLRVILVEVA